MNYSPSKNIFILCICILVITKTAYSKTADYRPGYIIKQANDTIRGLVLFKTGESRYNYCTFKTSETAEPEEYSPTKILGYALLNDSYFESKSIKTDNGTRAYFAEVLVKGKATLLRVMSEFYLEDSEHSIYVLEIKTTQTGKNVFTKELYKGILTWKLTGCNKVTVNKINSLSLNEPSLIKLFKIYNTCFEEKKDEVRLLLEEKKPWTQIRLGVVGGLSLISIGSLDNLPYSYEGESFTRDKSISGGLSSTLTSPRASERLALHLEVLYQKGTHEEQNIGETLTKTMYFEYTTLQIPITASFNLNTNTNLKFFIECGLKTLFVLDSYDYYQVDQIQFNSVNTFREENVLEIEKNYFSPLVGTGIIQKLNSKFQFVAKTRYEFGPAVITNGVQKTLSISAAILMNLN